MIDPVPQFDPSEHERRFPGRYHFHRAISHDVLPELPPVDAALIDGDHNWYTVFNELKMLAATAREAGAPLPVCFLHDVGWPYGRRDLYYAPERIPEEFRQPWAQKGLRLRRGREGRTDLLERGGFNQKMNNALEEGGPRNGVMTARRGLRRRARPRGSGSTSSRSTSASRSSSTRSASPSGPSSAQALDRLDDPAFLRELLELSERLRIKEMHWGQVVFYKWQDRLDLLGRALPGAAADEPRRRAGGRSTTLLGCLDAIREEKVDGDFVHCGAAGGDAAVLMRGFLQAHQMGSGRSGWRAPTACASASRLCACSTTG